MSFELEKLVTNMPFGIVYIDVRKAHELLADIGGGSGLTGNTHINQSSICAVTNASIIIDANDTACGLTDVERHNLIRSPVADILTEESRRSFVEALIRLHRGAEVITAEARLTRRDKPELSVVTYLWRPKDNGSLQEDFICLGLTNISARVMEEEVKENLQDKLAHAARIALLGEMVASIMHEINQPLGAIITSAEAGLRWLDNDEPDIEEVKTLLKRIVRNGTRASEVILAMRSMAQNKKTQYAPVSVSSILDEAVLILKSDLAKRQVGLQVEVESHLPSVLVDQTQILQVIVNLAMNAAQAMADGQSWNRTLLIRARKDGDRMVSVEVEDSGPGVDPSVREKLFESFYTTKETGIGMGLSICRSIIEAHGSKIELQSSPHLGARFEFKLRPATGVGAGFTLGGTLDKKALV